MTNKPQWIFTSLTVIILFCWVLWMGLALIFWNQAKGIYYILYAIGSVATFVILFKPRLKLHKRLCTIGLLALGMLFCWHQQEASHQKDWVDFQSELAQIKVVDSQIVVQNLRHDLSYMDGPLNWESREFDLSKLSEVRCGIVTFTEWRGLAHLFLSFNFENEKFLCVSGEIRREKSETYSPLKGCFKNYEMMVVWGSEKDIIGLRIFGHKDPVTFYPLDISKQNAQNLLLSLIETSNRIHTDPIFYNTITNNCATLIRDHFEKVYGDKYRWDIRLLFPGYADLIAFDENLVSIRESVENTRHLYLINDLADKSLDEKEWSKKIRGL